ncbi:MAG: methyltransferase domain-containing protein [Pseudomonadota bacterium]
MTRDDRKGGLDSVYGLDTPEAARAFYDGWSGGYDDEVAANAYATPRRCAAALAEHATDPLGAVVDLGCGTGLSGEALSAVGFSTLDGFDLSPGMLEKARAKGVYRNLGEIDLSRPLPFAPGAYANAAAVGVLTPDLMPVTIIDDVLDLVGPGGCFVFSINDKHAADGRLAGRIMELTDCGHSDLLVRERGEHLPGIGLASTVYLMRKR